MGDRTLETVIKWSAIISFCIALFAVSMLPVILAVIVNQWRMLLLYLIYIPAFIFVLSGRRNNGG